tara:strand:- start:1133 stop:2740 length:1608 start_codon:yes stop_codon:yes gene_type:complete
MHWAERTAANLAHRGSSHLIAAGITPSGEFHIGHIREILTCDMIVRGCRQAGLDAELLFIVDSMDPLRKVYSFLSPDYEKYIGRPLYQIPPPDENGMPILDSEKSYAEHFLNPFLDALNELGVELKLSWNHKEYKEGKFENASRIFLDNREEVARILTEVSGRPLEEDWWPYSPIGHDGSFDGITITGWEDPYVTWIDSNGKEGKSHIGRDEGKLPWRLDWPAKWDFHGVTCEPFGKDHAASGGSYATGRLLVEILGSKAPHPVPYEWIQLKGMGPMSSSANITVGPLEALEIVPPEILRYLIARNKPNRHIEFDTGGSLLEMADQYERLLSTWNPDEPPGEDATDRVRTAWDVDRSKISMSQTNPNASINNFDSETYVSFRHLSMVAQIRSDDEDVWKSLRTSGLLEGQPNPTLVDRLNRMRNWINSEHFPDEYRIEIRTELTDDAKASFNDGDRNYLRTLQESLSTCEWESAIINDHICNLARENGMDLRNAFIILYNIHLGKPHGPRLASVLVEIPRETVIRALENAINSLD